VNTEEAAVEWCALSKLVTWDKNPRRWRASSLRVKRSIEQFGFGAPLVARRSDMRILAGHAAYGAAKMLGMRQVPVRFLELSDTEADALTLADNRLGSLVAWDEDVLRGLLQSLDAGTREVTGWLENDLDKLLGETSRREELALARGKTPAESGYAASDTASIVLIWPAAQVTDVQARMAKGMKRLKLQTREQYIEKLLTMFL
jgi:ParB-like chromosome segregation protein Spo0J